MTTLNDRKRHALTLLSGPVKFSIRQIAERSGLSRRTVDRIMKDAGLKPAVQKDQIMRVLKAYGLEDVDKLHVALAFLKEDKHVVVRDYVVGLDEPAYNQFLASVIHLREAKRYNSSVTNAMQQLSNRANKNGNT